MPTEDDLIRKLRVLYGIAPGVADQQSFDGQITDLQRQLPGLAPTVNGWTSGTGASRGHATTSVNPAIAQLQDKIAALQRQRSLAPDQSLTGEADRNRAQLDTMFGGIRDSTLDEGTRQLNTSFVDTLRRNRTSLAARGLGGGSADRSTQSRTLSDLLLGRQRLTSGADAADQTARQSLDDQRQATERQIKLGTQPDISTVNSLRDASNGANQAYHNLTQQALGGLFVRAGDTYRDTNQADAYGRRGWGALSPSQSRSGSAGGTYT